MSQPIRVYLAWEAPKRYQELDPFGGEATYIAVVPKALRGVHACWLQRLGSPVEEVEHRGLVLVYGVE